MRSRWRRTGAVTFTAVVVAAVLLTVGRAGPAEAHAFLVRTDPAQGARLESQPRSIGLEFSEPVTGAELSLRRAPAGMPSDLRPRREVGGRVVRADLPPARHGIYLVSWGVVGADGHETQGEFAFAVGNVAGTVPAPRSPAQPADLIGSLASGLFFVGLALAAGSLATAVVVDQRRGSRPPALRSGLTLAMVGASIAWAQAIGDVGSAEDAPAREVALLAVTSALLAGALLVSSYARRWWPSGVAVAGAAVAWSAQGHNAVSNGLLGGAIDVVHLLAGATWAGALGLLVVDVWRRWRSGDPELLARARRYARLAAGLVVVLAGAGLASALLLLNKPADLWSTGYGRLLLAKSALFLGAVTLAVLGRWRGLRSEGLPLLRRATPVEAGLLVVVLGLSAVLVSTTLPAPATTAASLLGPPPMAGPLARDAGLAGVLTVAVSAGAGELQMEVIAPDGPAAGARVEAEARLPDGDEVRLEPRPCGTACFAQPLSLAAGTTLVEVSVAAPGWRGGTYTAGLVWPPLPEDPSLLTNLLATMRAVLVFELMEKTSSGPGSHASPVSLSLSGVAFIELQPYAAGVADEVQPLTRDGDAFRLYLPGDRIWVTEWLDDAGRFSRERVVSVGHVIERTFRYPR